MVSAGSAALLIMMRVTDAATMRVTDAAAYESGDWSTVWWLPEQASAPQSGLQVAIAGTEAALPHLIFVPAGTPPVGGWPLLIFLHGQGESSGASPLASVALQGPPQTAGRHPSSMPFVVLSPQKPLTSEFFTRGVADSIVDLVDKYVSDLRLDSSRVYLTGLSQGGIGTWGLASDERFASRFAAIAPVCGGFVRGDVSKRAQVLQSTPVWAFHGDNDSIRAHPRAPTEPVASLLQSSPALLVRSASPAHCGRSPSLSLMTPCACMHACVHLQSPSLSLMTPSTLSSPYPARLRSSAMPESRIHVHAHAGVSNTCACPCRSLEYSSTCACPCRSLARRALARACMPPCHYMHTLHAYTCHHVHAGVTTRMHLSLHGTWCMVHGTWCMVHGAWYMVHIACACVCACAHMHAHACGRRYSRIDEAPGQDYAWAAAGVCTCMHACMRACVHATGVSTCMRACTPGQRLVCSPWRVTRHACMHALHAHVTACPQAMCTHMHMHRCANDGGSRFMGARVLSAGLVSWSCAALRLATFFQA